MLRAIKPKKFQIPTKRKDLIEKTLRNSKISSQKLALQFGPKLKVLPPKAH